MTFESKSGFGLSYLTGGDATTFNSSLPLIKRIPIYPQKYFGLDYYHSNRHQLHPGCTTCFAFPFNSSQERYVDLLQFSNYGGLPTPLCPGVKAPSRWFADIRYTINTPLPHSYPSVGQEVLNSKRVCNAIEQQIKAGSSDVSRSLQRKARHFFTAMRASLSRIVCKFCGYILFKVFRRLMTKLLVSPEQMQRLQEANSSGIPLVYLPLHKSHLDYLMITWTAWHFNLPLPHIASGDNLNLSGLGWLLRATGAFFIRRRTNPEDETGKDAIYRAVLHSYIEQIICHGLPIEFFLEGTRSRFGKSLIPKHGLISNVVEAYQQGTIKDCFLVPVSYTYENVAEGIFLDELMGVPKVRESVFGVLRGILKGFRLSKRCGAVRMHFGQPVLLSSYISTLERSLTMQSPMTSLTRLRHSFSYRELVPWHHEHEEKVNNRTLIRAIGYHIVYEAQTVISISIPSVVSALLLCKFKMGVARSVLESDIEWLCSQIISEGGDVMGWNDTSTCGSFALEHALNYIGKSVELLDSQIEPNRSHRHLMNLAYHKNAVVPLFAVKTISLLSHQNSCIETNKLINDAAKICDWLQFEAIFTKPCIPIRERIRSQLNQMCSLSGQLIVKRNEEEDAFHVADLCPDSSQISIKDINSYYILLFYSNILRPFMQSLFMVVEKLTDNTANVKENTFIRTMCKDFLAAANNQPFDVKLEAINSDSFKNSIQVLREKKFISSDSADVRLLELEQLLTLKTYLLSKLIVFHKF